MTTGRHGGYHDHKFRHSESDFGISRSGFTTNNFNEEYDGIRNNGKGRRRDSRDRVITREREISNGSYRSSSSRSDSSSSGGLSGRLGPRRCDFPVKTMDREPGELSSESGSDEGVEAESLVKRHKAVMGKEFDYDVESESLFKHREVAMGKENGTQSPLQRKRKFSPIVWDQDDHKLTNLSKLKVVTTVTAVSPPPPFPRAVNESPHVPYNGVEVLPPENPVLSTAMDPSMVSESVQDAESESPIGLNSLLSEQRLVNGNTEQPEVEDYVSTRNISSSRWASGDGSSDDEGEIIDEKEILKKRRLSLEAGMKIRNKMLRPEESKIEGFERSRGKSSESEERGSTGRYSGEDDYPGIEAGKDNYMEIDSGVCKSDASGSHTNTDSEREDNYRESMESLSPPQRVVNMLQGCRSVDEFERLNKIDEGTYGVVYRAKDKKTGEIVALKKVKMEKEKEGFPLTSLREINILLSFHHPFIVDVKEVVVGSSLDSIFMVMEYMEHDLKGLMVAMKQPFSQSEVKCLMLQLLEGVKYLHDNWVLHRDLKTSNLLLNNRGELKICDFGLARQYGSPLKPYTSLVVTLWYRAPELLLGTKQYSTAIDMWSLGCIMAELLSKEPLFNGRTEFDQLNKIFRILGTPNETIWPGFSKLPLVKANYVKHQLQLCVVGYLASPVTHFYTNFLLCINHRNVPFRYSLLRKKFPATSFTGSPVLSDSGFDLLNKLLTYDPEKRITAEDALNHEWFREVPLPKSKEFMPTFPAQHDKERRMRRIMKSPHPLEKHRKDLQLGESGTVRVKWKSAFCPFC
ncbi:cyclin-dependent kinase G-2 isoform X3 [Lathyrus oleraceus]|uniref:cyclin-dependent kinase G-2 isoform X3 n=1 Tax=Pisum sativum TaxID=3888 RepID=UPI0021CF30A7|nr:cyclin-dependent kinase G-2-like isoform X3 [Pisum sativum]